MFCLFSGVVYAGAWTQKEGSGLLFANSSYYFTDKYFDNSGKKHSFAGYKKYEFNPYIEYGIKDDITIGANLFLQRSSQDSDSNIGIGDSEFFTRYRFWQKDGLVFSLEPMVKLPAIAEKDNQPRIGSKNFDIGLTPSVGYGFEAYGLNHFLNLDLGYRHRFGTPSDQLKMSFSAGFSFSEKTMLLTQFFATKRIYNDYNSVFTQSSGDDYDLSKLQISGIYKLDEKTALQLGIFSNVAGRNIGNGNGLIFAVSKNF